MKTKIYYQDENGCWRFFCEETDHQDALWLAERLTAFFGFPFVAGRQR